MGLIVFSLTIASFSSIKASTKCVFNTWNQLQTLYLLNVPWISEETCLPDCFISKPERDGAQKPCRNRPNITDHDYWACLDRELTCQEQKWALLSCTATAITRIPPAVCSVCRLVSSLTEQRSLWGTQTQRQENIQPAVNFCCFLGGFICSFWHSSIEVKTSLKILV